MLAKVEVEDRRIHMPLSFLLPLVGEGWSLGPFEEPNTVMNPRIEMITKHPSICSFLLDFAYS